MENVGDWKVEYAKSGRSRCRLTGRNIPNKALRIGEFIEGDYGQYAVWYNYNDFASDTGMVAKAMNKVVHGLSSISKADRDRVNALLGGGHGGASIPSALPLPKAAPKRAALKRQRDTYEEESEDDEEYDYSSSADDDDDSDGDHESSSDDDDGYDDGGYDDGGYDDGGYKRRRSTLLSPFAVPQDFNTLLHQPDVANLHPTHTPLSDALISHDRRVRFGRTDDDDDSDVDDHDGATSMAHIFSKMSRSHKGRQGQTQHQQLVQREPITAEQYIMGFIGYLIRTAPPEDPVYSDPSTVTTEDLEQMFNDMSPVEMQLLLSRMVKNADNEVVSELKRELQTVISERQHHGVTIVEE